MSDHHHELLECRNFYRNKLINYLQPCILSHINNLYLQTKESVFKLNTPKLILKVFQDNLKKIKDWNNDTITTELVKICSKNDISWLDELIKAVFIANYKIINILHNFNSESNLDININLPNTKLLIHTIYINISRELWKNPYLKYHKYNHTILNENKLKLDSLIKKTIEQTIEDFLPIEQSLQNIKETLEKQETERLENIEKEKQQKEKQEKERLENIEKEKQEKEKQEKEKQEKERLENIEKEKQQKERLENIEKEKQEKERLENIEKEKLESEKNINKTLQMDLYEKEEKENLKETIKNNIIKTNLKKNVINKDEGYNNDILMIEELNNSLQEIQTKQQVSLDNALQVSNSIKEFSKQTKEDMDTLLSTIANNESNDIKTVILNNKTAPETYQAEISDISEEDSDISDDVSFFKDAELF